MFIDKKVQRILSKISCGGDGGGGGGAADGNAAAAAGIGAAGTIGGGGLSGDGSINGAPGAGMGGSPGISGGMSNFGGMTGMGSLGQTAGQLAGDQAASLGIGNIGQISSNADAAAAGAPGGTDRGQQDALAMAVMDQDVARANQIAQEMSFSALAQSNMAMNLGNIPSALDAGLSITPISASGAGAIGAGLDAAFGIPSGLAANAVPGQNDGPAAPRATQLQTQAQASQIAPAVMRHPMDTSPMPGAEEDGAAEGTGELETQALNPYTFSPPSFTPYQGSIHRMSRIGDGDGISNLMSLASRRY